MTGWIPIEDTTRRPKDKEIIFISDGKEVGIWNYRSGEFEDWIDLFNDLEGHTSHWMPIELPEAPGGSELNARDAYDSGFAFADRVIGIDIHRVACNMLGDNATPENIEAWIAGFNAARRA